MRAVNGSKSTAAIEAIGDKTVACLAIGTQTLEEAIAVLGLADDGAIIEGDTLVALGSASGRFFMPWSLVELCWRAEKASFQLVGILDGWHTFGKLTKAREATVKHVTHAFIPQTLRLFSRELMDLMVDEGGRQDLSNMSLVGWGRGRRQMHSKQPTKAHWQANLDRGVQFGLIQQRHQAWRVVNHADTEQSMAIV